MFFKKSVQKWLDKCVLGNKEPTKILSRNYYKSSGLGLNPPG